MECGILWLTRLFAKIKKNNLQAGVAKIKKTIFRLEHTGWMAQTHRGGWAAEIQKAKEGEEVVRNGRVKLCMGCQRRDIKLLSQS